MNSDSFSKSPPRPGLPPGLTLLEVLIAIVILVFISLGIYQSTTSSFQIRETLQADSDFFSDLRMATSILERDISHVFTPTALQPPDDSQSPSGAGNPAATTASPLPEVAPTPFWGTVMNVTGMRHARLQGSGNQLSFIGASHVRVYKESRESIFSKILYKITPDPNAPEEMAGTGILTKLEDTDVFNPEDREDSSSLKTQALLYGIKTFKLRYFNRSKDTWLNEWDTENPDYRNSFPDLIEISLEVVGRSRLYFEGKFVFKPEIPFAGIPQTY